MDTYKNFAELAQNEREGDDYTISYREEDSPWAVVAIHGGGIEPGTLDIADAIAGTDYAFYAFKGIKKQGNKRLHISSVRYDEPMGLKIAESARIVISIHGAGGRDETVYIGGKNQDLKQRLMCAFRKAGIHAVISETPGLRGISPENICNRCRSGKGVQLEISRGLREKMFENMDCRSIRKKTRLFFQFVQAVKNEMELYLFRNPDPSLRTRSQQSKQ
jgi:phage replication-related protein YjqB (UPF0714/DUF867 family)